jgi:hypothetical protein
MPDTSNQMDPVKALTPAEMAAVGMTPPAAPPPPSAPESAPKPQWETFVEATLGRWFSESIHNSPVSRNPEAYAHMQAQLPVLAGLLKDGP